MNDATRLESLLAYQPLIQSGPFLTGVIHDLNNGVGAVIAYSELLGMGSHSRQELDKMSDDLLNAARRIANLSEALSTVARQEPEKKREWSVAKLVEQILLVCEYRFRSRGIRLDVSLDGDLEQPVTGYRNELARAVIYLLVNALENSETAARKEVDLAASVDAAALTVRVRDRGTPMTAEAFERALEPYVTTKPPPHLGLGLTRVREIAALHEGDVRYSSETGVILRIPIRAD